ncbi:hypothetical protein RA27_07485 [Ruegeria sp. ANG-R]|uniref:hypothetical protein n=1 Tax=Ruegeria sp. ANG-R TaxID=1577903 RepID=UPI00057E469A|nr:hypothetical protein [Ruegeria sp. ANG-R]KIC43138.1 hypothetical protein RA27_07485 [Ruegeria sp. ANG-R]
MKVILAYRIGQKTMGGKAMRVDQLSAMAKAHLSPDYSFEVALAPKGARENACRRFVESCKDAVVIFHKSAASNLGPEFRASLKKVAAGICVDHLDVVAGPFEPGFVDVHIAASYESERNLWKGLPALDPTPGAQVRHLRHHADPRLVFGSAPENGFKLGYFGLPDNVVLPSKLAEQAVVPGYDGKGDVNAFIARLSEANFHICTRDPSPSLTRGILSSKPFTKGFNAAVVGANVLVNRQVHDAEYYLGSDYPYFVDSTEISAISEGVARASSDFGGARWKMARARMDNVARQIAPAEVMAELDKILRLF